jgi:hypothetical protein
MECSGQAPPAGQRQPECPRTGARGRRIQPSRIEVDSSLLVDVSSGDEDEEEANIIVRDPFTRNDLKEDSTL